MLVTCIDFSRGDVSVGNIKDEWIEEGVAYIPLDKGASAFRSLEASGITWMRKFAGGNSPYYLIASDIERDVPVEVNEAKKQIRAKADGPKDEWVDVGKFGGRSSLTRSVERGDSVFRSEFHESWMYGSGNCDNIIYYHAASAIYPGDGVEANHAKKLLRVKPKADGPKDEWVDAGVYRDDIDGPSSVGERVFEDEDGSWADIGSSDPDDDDYVAVTTLETGDDVEVNHATREIRKKAKPDDSGADGWVFEGHVAGCDLGSGHPFCYFDNYDKVWRVAAGSQVPFGNLDYTAVGDIRRGDAVEVNRATKQIRTEGSVAVEKPEPVSDGNFDPVNRPAHYQHSSGFQPIHFMEHMGSPLLADAFAYLARREKKGDEIRDLEKALFYLKRFLAEPEIEPDGLDINKFVAEEPTPIGMAMLACWHESQHEVEEAIPALEQYLARRKAVRQ